MKTSHPGGIYCYEKAAKIKDLFPEAFCEGLFLKPAEMNVKATDGKLRKQRYIRRIFFDFLKIMIEDCIENNSKFTAPCYPTFRVFIKEKPDFEVRKILEKNTYKMVNLVESDFKIYEFCFYSPYLKRKNRYRNIRVGYKHYNQLAEKVNQGKRYFK